jgi:hypothetical protein
LDGIGAETMARGDGIDHLLAIRGEQLHDAFQSAGCPCGGARQSQGSLTD